MYGADPVTIEVEGGRLAKTEIRIDSDFGELSAERQQSVRSIERGLGPATVRLHVCQAWPALPEQQRLAVRDHWAAAVQSQVANAPCELFDALARAQLLPSFGQYKQPNLDRLVACWNEHPELATDRQGNALQRGRVALETTLHS